jgi:hypothetical protein
MSEKFLSTCRKQWRELNDTWQDDRCGGVRGSDMWAKTLCVFWQKCFSSGNTVAGTSFGRLWP